MASIQLPMSLEDKIANAKSIIERSLLKEKKCFGFEWAAKFLAQNAKEILVELIKRDRSNVFGRDIPIVDKNKIV